MSPELELELDPTFKGWRRPEGHELVKLARCLWCRAAISWARTPAGGIVKLDPSGRSHYGTCPDAWRWRRRVR